MDSATRNVLGAMHGGAYGLEGEARCTAKGRCGWLLGHVAVSHAWARLQLEAVLQYYLTS